MITTKSIVYYWLVSLFILWSRSDLPAANRRSVYPAPI